MRKMVFDWLRNAASKASGLMGKVGAGIKSAATGVMGKVKDIGGAVLHHAADGIKTAGHLAAHYAPQIGGALLGAAGNYLVPGAGGVMGRAAGRALGQSVKGWHDNKYGAKFSPETATGQYLKSGVKGVTKVARTIRKVSKSLGASAASGVASATAAAVKAITPKAKKVKIVGSSGGVPSVRL
jgi:hypothetical protein